MGLTSMAVTAIASATKYYIKESSRVEYFPIEAKNSWNWHTCIWTTQKQKIKLEVLWCIWKILH